MARIAYFYREMSEYIQIDLRMLREQHEVTVVGCPRRWPRPLATWRTVAAADVVWTWFASWHALLPGLCARLQGKPFVVCVGGYDTACLPQIGYGHQRGGIRKVVARAVIALATRLLPVSPFTIEELRQMRVPEGRVTLVPLALDASRYASGRAREAALVVTVGGVNASNLARKGLESFVRAAGYCPHLRFVVVGAWMDDSVGHLRALASPNVAFSGWASHAEKADWLARAGVVVQASQHEAFGLSLAEGMLCGATPVVTRAGSLPWVEGGTGVVVDSQDPEVLAAGVQAAYTLGPRAGEAARARVLAEFTLERRAAGLAAALAACGVSPVPGRVAAGAAGRQVA